MKSEVKGTATSKRLGNTALHEGGGEIQRAKGRNTLKYNMRAAGNKKLKP